MYIYMYICNSRKIHWDKIYSFIRWFVAAIKNIIARAHCTSYIHIYLYFYFLSHTRDKQKCKHKLCTYFDTKEFSVSRKQQSDHLSSELQP